MKKYVSVVSLFLIIGIMMQSCKDELNVSATNKTATPQKVARMNQNSYARLLEDLDDLDSSYGLTSVNEITGYSDWDFTDAGDSWSVVAADAEGACNGADIGERIGGKWGAVIGAVVVGAVSSVAEYVKEKQDDDNDGMQSRFYPNTLFVYGDYVNRFNYGNAAPIGSEIGDLHNSLVKEMLGDIDNGASLTTLTEIFEYAYSTNFSTLSGNFTPSQISEVQAFLMENETDIIYDLENNGITALQQMFPDEMEIIKHYVYVVSQSTEYFNRMQYTMDVMSLIDYASQNESISEERAILINGIISTLFCSKTGWNYIQPDPMWTNNYIIYTHSAWYITNNCEFIASLMNSNSDIQFFGHPYIENDSIKRIYVYGNSPYNIALENSYLFLSPLQDNASFTNMTDSVCTTFDMGLVTIPINSYPIYPATGLNNYIYIDLEQPLNNQEGY